MLKKERVYRELVWLAERKTSITQRELARACGVSLNLVNSVVRELRRIGAVAVRPHGLAILHPAKILYAWASQRHLEGDLSLRCAINLPVHEIEGNMPGEAVFTAFSGWRLRAGQAPFDYRTVYVYVRPQALPIVNRLLSTLPRARGEANVFVMAVEDPHLFSRSERQLAPVGQIFVDIYALPTTPTTEGFLRDILEKNPYLRL